MGETGNWFLDSPGFPVVVTLKNLRSYDTGAEDDDWNWGWWAYGFPALNE